MQEELLKAQRAPKSQALTSQLPSNMYCVHILFKTKKLSTMSKTGLVGKSHCEMT